MAAVKDEIPSEAMPSFIFRHFLHKDAKLSKLATHEDPYHIHKTLGVLSLLSFIYRYAIVYPKTGTLGFDGSRQDWLTMVVHTALACSAIQFRVPKKRINNKPMVIYEEYRQHAVVFTCRCFFVFAATTLFPNAPPFVPALIVMVHHLLADRITSIHGTSGNTAVRATSGHMKLSNFYKRLSKLYSFYQFLAIASHILPNARIGDLAFNAIIAIQSSAFMMTLYRKRIIRGRTHMVIYAFCLLVSSFHIVRTIGIIATALTAGAFLVRINLPRHLSNKYVIWALFLLAANLVSRFGYADLVSEVDTASEIDIKLPAVRGVGYALVVFLIAQGDQYLIHGEMPLPLLKLSQITGMDHKPKST